MPPHPAGSGDWSALQIPLLGRLLKISTSFHQLHSRMNSLCQLLLSVRQIGGRVVSPHPGRLPIKGRDSTSHQGSRFVPLNAPSVRPVCNRQRRGHSRLPWSALRVSGLVRLPASSKLAARSWGGRIAPADGGVRVLGTSFLGQTSCCSRQGFQATALCPTKNLCEATDEIEVKIHTSICTVSLGHPASANAGRKSAPRTVQPFMAGSFTGGLGHAESGLVRHPVSRHRPGTKREDVWLVRLHRDL